MIICGSVFFEVSSASADAVCAGKRSGEQCSLGDGHSADYGSCDASGNCVSGSTRLTTPASGPGSAGQISNNVVPGTTTEESDLIKCGRAGQRMCTLCDLIAGLNLVIQFIMKLSIGVGILAFTIAGVMYIISAGDSKMTGMAKETMKNAAIGFVIIFAGWVIINTTINSLGAYSNLGINITSWGQFECAARAR